MTPNLMMFGREVCSTVELHFGMPTDKNGKLPAVHVQEIWDKLQHTHDVARVHLRNSSKKRKTLFDRKVHEEKYNIGDLVWYETKQGQ